MKESSYLLKPCELNNQLFNLIKTHPTDLIRETIIHGCTGSYPPCYESLKHHVFSFIDRFMSQNEMVQIGEKLLWEVKFDELLDDLLSKEVILKSAKTGRYSGNKKNEEFSNWDELNKDILRPEYYFPEERIQKIEYVIYGTEKLLNTRALKEGDTYKAVWDEHSTDVKVVEIIGSNIFIGVGSDKVNRPYHILDSLIVDLLKKLEKASEPTKKANKTKKLVH